MSKKSDPKSKIHQWEGIRYKYVKKARMWMKSYWQDSKLKVEWLKELPKSE